jgi:hypothetical protein
MVAQARACESYRHVQLSGVFEAAVAVFAAPVESEAVTVIHAGCTVQRTPHPRELLVVVRMKHAFNTSSPLHRLTWAERMVHLMRVKATKTHTQSPRSVHKIKKIYSIDRAGLHTGGANVAADSVPREGSNRLVLM